MRIAAGPTILALVAAVGACRPAQPLTARQTGFDGERALQLVATQLEFGPRIPGTIAHHQTGEWILEELRASGWATETQEFMIGATQARNLIGRRGEEHAPLVILGAHYDTRPIADRDPVSPTLPVPGANDGASGVAVLLELARVLSPEALEQQLWLVFFDAEDGGGAAGGEWILGSRHFAAQLTAAPTAVVIVDMVGDADLQLHLERNSTVSLAMDIWGIASDLGYSAFIPLPNHSILDDHIPFLEIGIPSVDIIDFDYSYWHTTQDTLDKVSAESLEQVGRTLEMWLTSP